MACRMRPVNCRNMFKVRPTFVAAAPPEPEYEDEPVEPAPPPRQVTQKIPGRRLLRRLHKERERERVNIAKTAPPPPEEADELDGVKEDMRRLRIEKRVRELLGQ